MSGRNIVPILKWPGGKRWLAPALAPVLQEELSRRYFEPFLGAGAVFLSLRPTRATLSDCSESLIQFTRTIRRDPDAVVNAAQRLSNAEECFYQVRQRRARTAITKAARFLYLNKTCWAGLFRLNRNGDFNVPFGGSGRRICCAKQVVVAAKAFRRARLMTADFEDAMSCAIHGDVIYADPPYTTKGENNGFVRYNEELFSWADQSRLALAAKSARRRGAFVALSGLYHPDILDLYPGWWALKIGRSSLVSRDARHRGKVHEVLLFSRKPKFYATNEADGLHRI